MAERVSVIVASYNYEAYVGHTLQSIRDQSLPGWEALVIDDGSRDGSVDVIRRFCEADGRFRLLQHPGGVNRGLAASLQLAIGAADSPWIAFCESDDWWEPEFLQEVVAAADASPDCGVVFSDVILEGRSDTMETHCELVRNHFRAGGDALAMFHRMQNAVPTMSCALVRTDLIRACDFNPAFPPSLDMWLWAQLVPRTGFRFVDRRLSHWRQHEASYMKKSVTPGTLDMRQVHAFHAAIRALLPGGTPPRAEDAAPRGTWRRSLRRLGRLLRGT